MLSRVVEGCQGLSRVVESCWEGCQEGCREGQRVTTVTVSVGADI